MITQYETYNTIPQGVQDLIANKCHVLDQYIVMQTKEQEYTALVYNPVTKDCTQYIIYREAYTGNFGNYGPWTVYASDGSWDYKVTNEYYVYSNVGYGPSLDVPAMEGIQAHAAGFLVSVVCFAILFKGALFQCLKRKR